VSEGELHGIFIRVEVAEPARTDAELARKLEEACPVDIFAARDGQVQIVDENLDECVLCELCLDAAPPGAVRVVKRYDGDAALERTA
jgi:NAD-dependent dihydropyrimidine dehydrogenase PreA subunit